MGACCSQAEDPKTNEHVAIDLSRPKKETNETNETNPEESKQTNVNKVIIKPKRRNFMNCPGNHGIKLYRGSMGCDVCNGSFPATSSPMYGCRICDWDACFNCYMRARDTFNDTNNNVNESSTDTVKCEKKHQLRSFNCSQDGLLCNICKKKQLKEMPMKGCILSFDDSIECGWNVCYNCYYSFSLQSSEGYDEYKKEDKNGLFEDENECLHILCEEIEKYHKNDCEILAFPQRLRAPRYWAVLFQAFKYPNQRMRDAMDNIMIPLLDKSISEQICYYEPVYSFWCSWYIVCNQALGGISKDIFFPKDTGYSDRVFNSIKDILITKKGNFTSAEKKFVKSMLGWWYTKNEVATQFSALQEIANDAINELQQPLLEAYDKLLSDDVPLINLLQLDTDCINSDIASQNDLHPQLIEERMDIWIKAAQFNPKYQYKNKNRMAYECTLLSDWLKNQQLSCDGLYDYYQKHEMEGTETKEKEYELELTDDYFGLYYYFQIANKINDNFQRSMVELFNKNRIRMGLEQIGSLHEGTDIGVTAAPIKKLDRSYNKCKRDYKSKNYSRAGYILDYVRCAMIVENVHELSSLIQTICDEYKGGITLITRMKNRFHKDSEASFGYRSVMLNVIYADKQNPELYRLICEIQITSIEFLKARKFMHLYYKIIRAENTWDLALDVGAAS